MRMVLIGASKQTNGFSRISVSIKELNRYKPDSAVINI